MSISLLGNMRSKSNVEEQQQLNGIKTSWFPFVWLKDTGENISAVPVSGRR